MILAGRSRACALEALLSRKLRRNPRRALRDRLSDFAGAPQPGVEILGAVLRLRAHWNRSITQEEAFVPFLFHEMILDVQWTLGAMNGLHDEIVANVRESHHVREHMLRDAPLVIRADATLQYHGSVFNENRDVVGIYP